LRLDTYFIILAIIFVVIFMYFLIKEKMNIAIPFLILFLSCSFIILPIQDKQNAIVFKKSTIEQLNNTGYKDFKIDNNYLNSSSIKIYMNNKAYIVKREYGKLVFTEN